MGRTQSENSGDESNPLDRYMTAHKRAPRIRTGKHPEDVVSVSYHRGYVEVRQSGQSIYITRNDWVKVIRHALKMVKYMDKQFSVPRAIKRYAKAENDLLRELRQQKKTRYLPKKRRRRR